MHPRDLSSNTKFLNFLAGVTPAALTWYFTDSFWNALYVFVIGFGAGTLIFWAWLRIVFRNVPRNDEGEINPFDHDAATRRAMPVFLWAGPICGALAAAYFVAMYN